MKTLHTKGRGLKESEIFRSKGDEDTCNRRRVFCVRLGISCTLEGAGYKVMSAENGIEGIKLFEKEHFDIVITDLKLPGADGIKVLKSVKNISHDAGVIVITAFADVKTAVEAMKEGAYDYISKPF